MTIISVEQASNSLIELIKKANDGEEVIITYGEEPVAKIIATSKKYLTSKKKIKTGSAKGLIEIADDFDEPLDDFKEYMYGNFIE